jgi:V/A-type H+-transporting ATPase subunit A
LLSLELGPGLIGMVYDGLQNPLPEMAEKIGKFLKPGNYLKALDRTRKWEFTPLVEEGETLSAAENLGKVKENIFDHFIMAPFTLVGEWKIKKIVKAGQYRRSRKRR